MTSPNFMVIGLQIEKLHMGEEGGGGRGSFRPQIISPARSTDISISTTYQPTVTATTIQV